MKTVHAIIELFGGIAALRDNYIKVRNGEYMPLVIEWVGEAMGFHDSYSNKDVEPALRPTFDRGR